MTDSTLPTNPMDRLLEIMARLRDPRSGCPWDREQSFATIAPYTIEEAHEVADAIARGAMDDLRDELGDLLLQVVFHAQMAGEAGLFAFSDVANAISTKMIARHPHVFGEERVDTAEAQTRAWEEHKAAERARAAAERGETPSVLDGVALGLPALMRAEKLQKRAARIGFEWPGPAQPLLKIEEELSEIKQEIESGGEQERIAEEVGDLLFAAVALARSLAVDPETALREANRKFEKRFRQVETRAPEGAPLSALQDLWIEAKNDR
ncbi:MAG: nucleoside triphosphate pyrophosphohydrolase [Dongiaceae bacterium]